MSVSKKKTAKKKTTPKKPPVRGAVDTRTFAQRRREVTKDEIRKKFQGIEYVRQLEEAAKEYDEISKALDVAMTRRQKLTQAEMIRINGLQLDALKVRIDVVKAKVDLNLKRLRYVLPELKAISFEDGNGNSLTEQFFEAMKEAAKNNHL